MGRSHSPQEAPCHRRVSCELPVVHGVRGPAHDSLVHAVLHGQCSHHAGTTLLSQALHQAERQPLQCCPAPKRGGMEEILSAQADKGSCPQTPGPNAHLGSLLK